MNERDALCQAIENYRARWHAMGWRLAMYTPEALAAYADKRSGGWVTVTKELKVLAGLADMPEGRCEVLRAAARFAETQAKAEVTP